MTLQVLVKISARHSSDMFSVRLFVCLSALYVGAHAAVAILAAQEKPAKYANSEGCYIPDLDMLLKYGEVHLPEDHCNQYTCDSNGNVQIVSCGAVGVADGCEKAEGNPSLPYPKCCSGIRCKKTDGTYIYHYPY